MKTKKKICVLIRVYDRTEDLLYNLKIIRDTWKDHYYDVYVVSNGINNGYNIPENTSTLAKSIINLKENAGHLKGNSQLLMEGMKFINIQSYDYLIILEADTWLYTDKIISKYIKRLENSDAVWASARWYDKFYSLATDFAIIKTSFLEHNIDIFNFTTFPECYVCNYLIEHNKKYILIKENMYVNTPSYIKHFPFAPNGRFFCFPASKMVTHHIELLKGGMNTKKKHFNIIARYNYFHEAKLNTISLYLMNSLIRISLFCNKCMIKKSWYSKREQYKFEI